MQIAKFARDRRTNLSGLIREHEIARISCEYREIKNRECKKIRELSTRTYMRIRHKQEKGQKWDKRSKRLKIAWDIP